MHKVANTFNDNPILNSPYQVPEQYWELNTEGQPTGNCIDGRRRSQHLVPIPEAQQQRRKSDLEPQLNLEDDTKENPIINHIRSLVDDWRAKPEEKWGVTSITTRLLRHWREGGTAPKPFFCQVEAAETLIWLNEVAPSFEEGKKILTELEEANREANPELFRFASKMATGAGKTLVMAMMIAYHTLNKVRQPKSKRFSSHFLIITPGITIRDRLRVLLPSDPDNYYARSKIVPDEYLNDIQRAQIVITNYHAFKHRETVAMSSGARAILKGHAESDISTVESVGQMLTRVCKELLNAKSVVVINDEAHHCYRHKVNAGKTSLTGDDREEADKNNEAARLWISGIESLGEKNNIKAIYDLSATPFFLRGSGYREGKLFPWTVSDFALMDAIESGIVKLPRVPIDDGTMSEDKLPIYRNLYKHVAKDLPKKGRRKQGQMDPEDLPVTLQAALETLYGHYEKTSVVWDKSGSTVPPVFIVVCNNTSTSKLVYDFISGYELPKHLGRWKKGKFPLFSNVGDNEKPSNRLRTLLIDSEQIDSGESMSKEFKQLAAPEIDQFQKERRQRNQGRDSEKITDEDLLREVMNTIGKKGKLGEQIRCVVSVSMLTEGWDTNNVTHILGVRAFGTQLLCEQVVGRGLRRYTYEVEEDGKFAPEYADVFGVPFSFATGTKIDEPKPLKQQYRVHAQRDRAHASIHFPRVRAYTIRIPDKKLVAKFNENHRMTLKLEDAPPKTLQRSIVGEEVSMTLERLKQYRENEIVFHLAAETTRMFADKDGEMLPARFRDLVPITRRWMKDYLTCPSGTLNAYLMWKKNTVSAAEKIRSACIRELEGEKAIIPVVDKFNPEGSSFHVDFLTRKLLRFDTSPGKCHVNIAVCDSNWEVNFCQFLEDEPAVHAWIRNEGLGFEIPYEYNEKSHVYLPDFIVRMEDGHGADNLRNLIVEIKGYRDDKDKVKAETAEGQWVPAVKNDGRWGYWDFVEITNMEQAREILADIASGRKARDE